MAGEADKCIGRLTLDIKDVEQKVAKVNEELRKLGAGVKVDMGKMWKDAIKRQLDEMVKQAQETGQKMRDAMTGGTEVSGGLKSTIARTTSEVQSFGRAMDANNQVVESFVGKVTTGFDAAGNKVREFANANREITKRTEEVNAGYKKAIELYTQLYDRRGRQYEMQVAGKADTASYAKITEDIQRLRSELNSLGPAAKAVTTATADAFSTDPLERFAAQYQKVLDNFANTKNTIDQNKRTEDAIKLWNEYYDVLTKAEKAVQSDNLSRASSLRKDAEDIKIRASALREESAVMEQTTKARERYNDTYEQTQSKIRSALNKEDELVIKQEKQEFEGLIALYKQYYDVRTQQTNATNNADTDMYRNQAESIKAEIDAIAAEKPALAELAMAHDTVTAAVTRYTSAVNTSHEKSAQTFAQGETEAVNEYAQALIRLYNEQTKFNNAMASGKQMNTQEFTDAQITLKRLGDEVQKSGEKLKNMGVDASEAVSSIDKVRDAADALRASEDRLATADTTGYLNQAKQAYFDLTQAISRYNDAKKTGDSDSMATQQQEIDLIMQRVAVIREAVEGSNLEASAKQQILNYTEQCVTAEGRHSAEINKTVQGSTDLENQLNSLLTRYLSVMAVVRGISNLIQNTVEYVSQYYDKMNEIQIITQKSNAEVAKLGDTYRQIASDMSVSSLDMADAAIYFTRQGLQAEEIENRLRNTTMYAKTANIEFERAAELITAVVNSMDLVEEEAKDGRNATQRVADVFLKVGDSAATSGEEIGEAMQKAAAAAGAFGVSFEWLTASIAAVSETTRQEARSIGTAFNTIIARLHNIRSTGYNSEDETRINDIAKALAHIDIALMDNEGNWRSMETIFGEIAEQWDTLDGKTKSYIATTMAGVKQQNVFLALMEDMSKGAKNAADNTGEYSRQMELYGIAMDAAGTAEQKYAVYKDSVTASQERLNVAQERFYSLLDANVIKGWNDALAGFINMITNGADALGTWSVIVPVVAGALTAVGVIIHSINAGLLTTISLTTLLEKHPIMVAISAAILVAGGLVTIINAIGDSVETAEEKFNRANRVLSETRTRMDQYSATQTQLRDMLREVGTEAPMTSDEIERYNGLLETLAAVSPKAAEAVKALTDPMGDQEAAAKTLNDELDRVIRNQQIVSAMSLITKYGNMAADNTEKTPQDKMLDAMSQWETTSGDDWFKNSLRDYYNHEHWYLPDEVKNRIFSLRDAVLDIEDTDVAWGYIADIIWAEFVGDGSATNLTEAIDKKAQEYIDDVMQTLGYTMGSIEQGVMRRMLTEAIYGEDMELSGEEYSKIGMTISKFISDAMNSGFNFAITNPRDLIMELGDRLFGDAFVRLFGDQMESMLQNTPDEIQEIINEYYEMIAAGMSDADIAEIFDSNRMIDWASGLSIWYNELRNALKERFGEGFLTTIMEDLDLETGEATTQVYSALDELDGATVKLISDLIDSGVSTEQLNALWTDSWYNAETFAQKLGELSESIGATGNAEEETTESTTDLIKEIKSAASEIESLNKYIKAIKDGESIDFEDLLDLAAAHPEIAAAIGDVNSLLAALNRLKNQNITDVMQNMRNAMISSTDVFSASEFAGASYIDNEGIEHTATNFKDILDNVESYGKQTVYQVNQYLDQTIASFLASTGQLGNVGKDILAQWMTGLFGNANMDLLNRPILEFADHIETMMTETLTASKDGTEGVQWNQDIVVNMTPITKDGKKLTEEELHSYFEELLAMSTSAEGLLVNDMVENDGKGLIIGVDTEFKNFDEGISKAEALAQLLSLLQEAYYGVAEANKTWLEIQMEQAQEDADNAWAEQNGYIQQVYELQRALEEGGPSAAMDVWNSYNESLKASITGTYPDLLVALTEMERALNNVKDESKDAEDAEEGLNRAYDGLNDTLNKTKKYLNTKYFTDTAKAMKQLREGTISAKAAYDAFEKEVDKVAKAHEEVTEVQTKLAAGSAIEVDDVKQLAEVLGLSADQVVSDFPKAISMFEELKSAGAETLNALNKEAVLRITGMSEADFSQIENGLLAIQADAQATIDMLTATGQWEIQTENLPQTGEMWDPVSGTFKHFETNALATFLKPSGQNPFQFKITVPETSGGGGGGGGGGGNKDSKTQDAKMLESMKQVKAYQDYRLEYYRAMQSYFSETGELQGVIAYYGKEIDVLNEQNETLEKNIDTIRERMELKRAELAGMSEEDENYDTVKSDVDALTEAYQTYSIQLVNNRKQIESVTQAIKDQRDAIRDMEIGIQDAIYKAIEDREAKRQNMFNAEVDMENTILDLIKKRYEKERDEIIETTQEKIDALDEEIEKVEEAAEKQIDALNEESDLLSEQLKLRKDMYDQQNKAAELAKLEAQYQRIVADPTRAKEAQSIQEKITKLREEMAWDAAEAEVKARQDQIDANIEGIELERDRQVESLEQQKESLEDYIESVEEYYEDLFEHPQQLIEEMRSIIELSQDEIIEWLMANDEEYAKSSENTQKKMVDDWTSTLNDMYGIIQTHWDEVYEIYAQGDDAIISFLKEHSSEYAEAGKLQAEAYVEEWEKKLDDLRKALTPIEGEDMVAVDETVGAADMNTTVTVPTDTGSSSSGTSGGGGGGGGGSKGGKNGKDSASDDTSATDGASGSNWLLDKLKEFGAGAISQLKDEYNALTNAVKKYHIIQSDGQVLGTYDTKEEAERVMQNMTLSGAKNLRVSYYKSGGLATKTGLAWLDGTLENPERVLNPYQTQLFDSMVKALEQIGKINVPSMPNLSGMKTNGGGNVSVGDIIVNVDNLDTDADYEELAEKVSEVLMSRIGRTTAVGGIRVGSY